MRGPLRRILERRPLRNRFRREDSDDVEPEPSRAADEPRPSLYSTKAKEEPRAKELKADKVNFPSDRDYTLNTMQEQFGLMELHLRDGSYLLCNCNPEKHLPLLAGLAAEGVGFTDDPDEKLFMDTVRDTARTWRAKIRSGSFTGADADKLRSWAREQRHRIEYKVWHGRMPENPEFDPELCPTCNIGGLVAEKLKEEDNR